MKIQSYKYRIYGRTKGRKKIKFDDRDFFENCKINLEKDIKKNPYQLNEFFSYLFFCHKLCIYLIFFSLGSLLIIIIFIKYDSKNK